MRRTLCLFGAAIAFAIPARAADPPAFEWKDGDRVVMIGDTLIERDQKYGYLETLITAQNPDKTITFRNLGWSGDTVRGLSRARFGPPAEGFQHLKDHVLTLKPTVLIVGYGMAESFDGEAGLPGFVSGMNELLDEVTVSKPRLIFLSPIDHLDFSEPVPRATPHSRDLRRYRDAIASIAEARKASFVDLYVPNSVVLSLNGKHSDDGIHLTDLGYWLLALSVETQLSKSESAEGWTIQIGGEEARRSRGNAHTRPVKLGMAKVSDLEAAPDHVKFHLNEVILPIPDAPLMPPQGGLGSQWARKVRVLKMSPGRYSLTIDGKAVASADVEAWAKEVPIVRGPEVDQVESLRKAIVAKNELYFYRWRPQNETYLFGFRKHEQGDNAREIPLFDPLVEEKEKEIARLKKPVPHVYELVREKKVDP